MRFLANYFYDKIANSKKPHPLYIIPTLDGIKVIVLNLLLLTIGLVYANNYVLLFNFMLFCLFLASMFYTHFNLTGLKISSISFNPIHANELSTLTLYLESTNRQGHFFIGLKIKSSIFKIEYPNETFQLHSNSPGKVEVVVRGLKRGKEQLAPIYIQTLFPFDFFRCFTFFNLDQSVYVYPERINLKIHSENLIANPAHDNGEELHIKNFQIGDSLKRVDWKKLAQTNRWYIKELQTLKPGPVILSTNYLKNKNISKEELLKSICFSLYEHHQEGREYGIELGENVYVSPENSAKHLDHCLRELARYEV